MENGCPPFCNSRDRWWLLVCLLIAIGLRCGVLWWHAGELTRDRDAYLGIAQRVAEGQGYTDADRKTPTAFRPPLYPLQLAGLMVVLPAYAAVATVNLLWGVISVWATWRAGQWLNLGSWSSAAALLVAIDPMLLQYSAQPMTEVTCTGIVSLLVLWMVRRDGIALWRRFGTGVLFGMLVMCRPTFWPMVGWLAVFWMFCSLFRRGKTYQIATVIPWPTIVGTLLVVGPWVVRNQITIGSPIAMTTHGGYTLLLANNPVYYSDVVERGWGSEWTKASFDAWQADLHAQLAEQLGPNASELERDRWQNEQARRFVVANPVRFLHAVWHRVHSLWSTVPQSEAAASISSRLIQLVGWYYTVVLLTFVVGMLAVVRRQRCLWTPLFALLLTVQLVHLFYWTNARMRAPIIPVISLFAVAAFAKTSQAALSDPSEAPAK